VLFCAGKGQALLGVLEDSRRAASQHIHSILCRSCPMDSVHSELRVPKLLAEYTFVMVSEGL